MGIHAKSLNALEAQLRELAGLTPTANAPVPVRVTQPRVGAEFDESLGTLTRKEDRAAISKRAEQVRLYSGFCSQSDVTGAR